MTVKFASKFHHGNPFVRGLLFAGSAAPFEGEGVALFGAGAVSARAKAGSCCAGIV